MSLKEPDTATLLAEHSRLIHLHGPDSAAVYEFEMAHLSNAEFLQRAVAEKRIHSQRRLERHVLLWFLLFVAILFAVQVCALAMFLYRPLL